MAKAAKESGGTGMEKGELKTFLRIAKGGTAVSMAFAIGGDGKAMIHMDKRKPPRSLEKHIKESAPEAKNHRFGQLMVLPENPKVARFVVNKAAGGVARKLVVALKGTGFSKVEVVLEDGSPVEDAAGDDEDEFEDEEGHGHQGDERETPPTIDGTADHDDETTSRRGDGDESNEDESDEDERGAQDEDSEGKDTGDDEDAGQKPDAGELARELTGLVKRMIGVIAKDPKKKVALSELATDAQASLKRGDLEQAAAGLDVLRTALGSGGDDGTPDVPISSAGSWDDAQDDDEGKHRHGRGGRNRGQDSDGEDREGRRGGDEEDEEGEGHQGGHGRQASGEEDGDEDEDSKKHRQVRVRRLHKSRAAWMAARAKIEADIQKLSKHIMQMHDDNSFGGDLESQFNQAIEPVLSQLDHKLAHIMEQAAKAKEQAEHEQLLKEVHAMLERHRKFVASSPVIKHIDTNPFIKIDLGKMLGATLNTLSSSLR